MTKQVGTTGEPNRWSPTPALEGWLFARNASLFAIVAMVVPRFIGLQAQSGWERYVARPLWRIVQQHKATLASEPGQVVTAVSADQFPSVTSLCFTGGERELDSETETFVTAYWLRVLRQPPPAKVAHRVFQFADDSMFYWIALQDTLLDSFRAEMKPGASARVWVVWLGALTRSGQLNWVFLINAFEPLAGSGRRRVHDGIGGDRDPRNTQWLCGRTLPKPPGQ